MALALKVGQRTRLSVSFMRVDGSPGPVASPPTWTSSNPALVAISGDPASSEGLSVYVECLGPVDPAVTAELVRARRRDDRLTRLTEREREALGQIPAGHSNRAIAEHLGITTKTLEGMSGTIFAKLGLEDDPDVNPRVLAVLLYLDGAGE